MLDFPRPQTSDPSLLASELHGCLRTCITTKTLRSCPGLLSLALIAAKAASDAPADRAAAAHGLLRECCTHVDGSLNGPTAVLMGLAPGTRGTLLKERRRRAADLLFISPAHLRTSDREQALIEALADELYALDSTYRRRHQHRVQPERTPQDSRLGIDWLDRHQTYRRIWTPIAALRDDLAVLLELVTADVDYRDICDRLMTIAWRQAQYSTELQRFITDYGGLWLMADLEREVGVAHTVQQLGLLLPFGEADHSWLRLVLTETGGELEPFSDRLMSEERGAELLGVWLAWARSCTCADDADDQGPDSQCDVHVWIGAVDAFSSLLDTDWVEIADWYRAGSTPLPRHAS